MRIAVAAKGWGNVIFCDDIRHEVQNTISLIGVYNKNMIVDNFPITLPKFGLFVRFNHFMDTFSGAEGVLKVFLPGNKQEIFSLSINLNPLRPGERENKETMAIDDLDQIFCHQFPLISAPITIECEGAIRVRVYIDDEEYRIGALDVVASREALPPASTQFPPGVPAR